MHLTFCRAYRRFSNPTKAMPKKVLIIEDDELYHLTYAEVLEELGCESSTATTFEEAEAKIKAGGWDIVIVDGSLDDRGSLDTLPLARLIKEICPKAISIPNSREHNWNEDLLEAGCNMPNYEKLNDESLHRVISECLAEAK